MGHFPMRHTPGMPWPNEPAPDFKAMTTHVLKTPPESRRKWLAPFPHPAAHTPVCTTGFAGFARSYPRYQALDYELLGLSIDSTLAHIAWAPNIKVRFGIKSPLPIIEDLSRKLAHTYHSCGEGGGRPLLMSNICIQTLTQRRAACASGDQL